MVPHDIYSREKIKGLNLHGPFKTKCVETKGSTKAIKIYFYGDWGSTFSVSFTYYVAVSYIYWRLDGGGAVVPPSFFPRINQVVATMNMLAEPVYFLLIFNVLPSLLHFLYLFKACKVFLRRINKIIKRQPKTCSKTIGNPYQSAVLSHHHQHT